MAAVRQDHGQRGERWALVGIFQAAGQRMNNRKHGPTRAKFTAVANIIFALTVKLELNLLQSEQDPLPIFKSSYTRELHCSRSFRQHLHEMTAV